MAIFAKNGGCDYEQDHKFAAVCNERRCVADERHRCHDEAQVIHKRLEKRKAQNMQKYSSSNSENALTVYEKDSFIKKIINKIRNLFKKKQ